MIVVPACTLGHRAFMLICAGFIAEVCKKQWHVTRKVPGDGNCFFRSAAFLETGTEEAHELLRMNIVNEVRDNDHRYADFTTRSTIDWASGMLSGSWGDELAVKACPAVTNKILVVFRKNTDQLPSVFPPPVVTQAVLDADPQVVELDETNPGSEHYNPMEVTTSA